MSYTIQLLFYISDEMQVKNVAIQHNDTPLPSNYDLIKRLADVIILNKAMEDLKDDANRILKNPDKPTTK